MVPLSPKLVQVLACLAEGRGELVSRELLLDRFWPDVNVTDNTLTRAIADIRHALDDAAGTRRPTSRPWRGAATASWPRSPKGRRRPSGAQPGRVAVSERGRRARAVRGLGAGPERRSSR